MLRGCGTVSAFTQRRGKPLIKRFADEAAALRSLGGRAPFVQLRDLVRKVRPDCVIDLDTNSYSVP